MSSQISLKDVERKSWLAVQRDGMADMVAGMFMILFWINHTFLRDQDWIARILVLVPLLLFLAVKRYFVQPRMGIVKFGPRRTKKRATAFVILLISVVLNFVLILVAAMTSTKITEWLDANWIPALILAKIIIVLSLLAFLLDFPRLYYMLVFIVIAFIAGEFFDQWIVFLISGLIIFVPGLFLLVKFLREHPFPDDEEKVHV